MALRYLNNGKETIRNLCAIFDTFGNPSEIVSDRGTAFTSVEFEDFVHSVHAKHRKVAVATPWVKRNGGAGEQILKKLVNKDFRFRDRLGNIFRPFTIHFE